MLLAGVAIPGVAVEELTGVDAALSNDGVGRVTGVDGDAADDSISCPADTDWLLTPPGPTPAFANVLETWAWIALPSPFNCVTTAPAGVH